MTPEVTKLYHQAVRVLLYKHADWLMAVDAVAILGPDRITVAHYRQITQRLLVAKEVERSEEGGGRVFYRWCGPDLGDVAQPVLPPREAPAKPAQENITPPRRYGNAAMPTATPEYWRQFNNWGRT